MANETEIILSGRYLTLKNTTTRVVYFTEYVDELKYFREDDNFSFYPSSVQTNNITVIRQSRLGQNPNGVGLTLFDYSTTLNPDTGLVFVDADTMEAWIQTNVGFFDNPNPINVDAAINAVSLFGDYEATLLNGAEIDSGWIDTRLIDKYLFRGKSDSVGMTMVIESSNVSGGGEADTNTTTEITVSPFHLFSVPPRDDYMRFRWQNNTGVTVNDAYLGIKGTFGSSDKASVFPVYTEPSQFSQATLVQAILRGRDIHDNYQNVSVNPNGEIQTARYIIDAARNEIVGMEKYDQIGKNPAISTSSTPEDITLIDGIYTGFDATSGEAIQVSSANAQDTGTLVSSGTATGGSSTTIEDTGATFVTDGVAVGDCVINDTQGTHGIVRTVTSETVLTVWRFENEDIHTSEPPVASDGYRVATTGGTGVAVVEIAHCLETDYDGYITEYIILNGVTPVDSIGTDYIRNAKARVVLCGSNGNPEGLLTGHQTTTTANVFWNILTTENTAQNALDTVPKNKTLYAWVKCQMARASGAAGSAEMKFMVRPVGEVWEEIIPVDISNSQGYETPQEETVVINEYADYKWNCFDVSDNNTKISAQADGYLVTNT